MSRRHFLQSLLALGAVISLPPGVVLAGAADREVDEAFAKFLITPWLFHVDENDMIFDPLLQNHKPGQMCSHCKLSIFKPLMT